MTLLEGVSMGARKKRYRAPRNDNAPPPERHNHGQTIKPYTATEQAGVYGAIVVEACLLDALLERGHLGKDLRDAQRRHNAGIWLREQFFRSGLHGLYATGFGRPGGGRGEMSDDADKAMTLYSNAIRELGREAGHIASEIACHDRWPRYATARRICDALDALAKLRAVEKVDNREGFR